MKLSTQKTVAKGVGIAAVAGLGLWGLTSVFSGDDNNQQVAVNKPAVTHVQPPVERYVPPVQTQQVEQPIVVAPVKRGDTPEEKAVKIANLQSVDADYLARNGFTVRSYLNYGTCNDNGGLTNNNWRGIASGMSYAVDKNGATFQACVLHNGGKAVSLTSNYTAAVVAPKVEQPAVTQPAVADVPFTKGNTDANRDTKLADMRRLDGALLADKGMTLVRRLNVGEACAADGSISGDTKWKGTASSIQYEARMDGERLQVCINHSGGKPAGQVTGSKLKL